MVVGMVVALPGEDRFVYKRATLLCLKSILVMIGTGKDL